MKIINGKKYSTKEDTQKRFLGIENYEPRKKSLERLFIRISSGTTGGTPSILALKFTFGKALLNFFEYSKPLLVIVTKIGHQFIHVQTVLNCYAKPSRILVLSKKDIEHPLMSSVIADFGPQAIHSLVSPLNLFIDKLYGGKADMFSEKIKKVYISGEMAPKELLNKSKKIFPKGEIGFFYGIGEIGITGVSCRYLMNKYKNAKFVTYHPTKSVSIFKPSQDNIGEISVYSPTLHNFLTGDEGEIIKEKCRCGATETLCVHGRINYDIVNCIGAVFHILEVERVFSSLYSYVNDYYLEIKEVHGEGKTLGSVVIKVVPTAKLRAMDCGEKFISEFVQGTLQLTKTRSLGDLVKAGIFLPPIITYVSSLSSSGKKVRMRKVEPENRP